MQEEPRTENNLYAHIMGEMGKITALLDVNFALPQDFLLIPGVGCAVSNCGILDNFKNLCSHFPNIPKTVRTPVIPGFNDDPEEIRSLARLLKPFPNVNYELLPYHGFG